MIDEGLTVDLLRGGVAGVISAVNAPDHLGAAIGDVIRRGHYLQSSLVPQIVDNLQNQNVADGSEYSQIPILRTKLHRPSPDESLIHRARLEQILEEGKIKPLTLVSAPAGYGKSVLVSQWLESCEWPSSWVSLEATDGELATFVRYFIAAVETITAEACWKLCWNIRPFPCAWF